MALDAILSIAPTIIDYAIAPIVRQTTLVNEIARRVNDAKLFDSVVIATVTRTPNIKIIQGETADQLGLKFKDETEVGRAGLLLQSLSQEKILMTLDDLWARLDLHKVGIPLVDAHTQEPEVSSEADKKGCKLLLTSRNLDVLSRGMNCQKGFPLGVLHKTEAWELFKSIAGDQVDNPDVHSTAIQISKKCAGLPVAIVIVAATMRNNTLPNWKNALVELQRPSSFYSQGI
ncbi:hypothetical protein Tsubulata_021289 [Turnera subulata]|uniref:NB-ARC domain-containing protein n=1 Tax=Turnera subulata TaxID=218843 RepID=A0A9Q0G3Q7_9ROSI|nr:hypothetical protein Tsubulata_021289 [Turnera subulata]